MSLLRLLLIWITPFCALAQSSTFDTSIENWNTNGDPSNSTPGWINTGGNPDGYIRGTDAVQGGIWYFVAPAKFLGPQCETYGKYFRWDQNINNSTNPLDPGGAPDLIFKGAGLTLAWDNPIDPGITWTHYDVLLQEDAGWRLNSNTGPPPTQAQFMAVLGNLTTIQIRGEYRYGADFGGLDNVILENSFAFDLDGDDSSGALNGNFNADSTCLPRAPLADVDAIFTSEKRVDSIVCQVQFAQNPALELLQSTVAANNIGVISSPGQITLYNLGGATLADFRQALLGLEYFDSSPMPFRGIRIVAVRVYTECGEAALRYAYLPIFPPADAGTDATVKLCQNDAAIDLQDALTVPFAPDGLWKPALGSGSLFRPGTDTPGTFVYIVPQVGDCPGDTALIEVSVETPFQLRSDTLLCYDDTLRVPVPSDLLSWQWSTGSRNATLAITTPGTYRLTGQTELCTASDSFTVDFYRCRPCDWYAPNVFSPNDDGWNDCWQVFLPCESFQYRLEVFDRWGNLIFSADDPDTCWDGYWRGKEAPVGVYLWRLEWEGELFGERKLFRDAGDVTVVR